MDKDRSTAINIGGQEYQLILTTKATKEIAGRYGGLENLGDKLMKATTLHSLPCWAIKLKRKSWLISRRAFLNSFSPSIPILRPKLSATLTPPICF
jgi:hypothetical protein